MAEFKVGGTVICVKDHSRGVVKKNTIHTVHGLRDAPCKCGLMEINIGITSTNISHHCAKCGQTKQAVNGYYWLSERLFLPLDDFKEVTFTELKTEMPVSAQ